MPHHNPEKSEFKGRSYKREGSASRRYVRSSID